MDIAELHELRKENICGFELAKLSQSHQSKETQANKIVKIEEAFSQLLQEAGRDQPNVSVLSQKIAYDNSSSLEIVKWDGLSLSP